MAGTKLSETHPSPVRMAGLEARLADSEAEIAAAQALRYRVFYDEMGAIPSANCRALRRDFDNFDAVCDHLLVIDRQSGDFPCGVVGTYRLLRRSAALDRGGFYTANEFDIAYLLAHGGEIMELGRSCVAPAYRDRPTMQLLWRGVAAYVFHHRIELMFGCASFPDPEPMALALPLSYLFHAHLAPPALRPKARPGRYVDMCLLPEAEIDQRRALSALPPLLKGYLRLGGFVGDGAVVDRQFNTTDVCVVVKTDLVTDKYYRYYERAAQTPGAS